MQAFCVARTVLTIPKDGTSDAALATRTADRFKAPAEQMSETISQHLVTRCTLMCIVSHRVFGPFGGWHQAAQCVHSEFDQSSQHYPNITLRVSVFSDQSFAELVGS